MVANSSNVSTERQVMALLDAQKPRDPCTKVSAAYVLALPHKILRNRQEVNRNRPVSPVSDDSWAASDAGFSPAGARGALVVIRRAMPQVSVCREIQRRQETWTAENSCFNSLKSLPGSCSRSSQRSVSGLGFLSGGASRRKSGRLRAMVGTGLVAASVAERRQCCPRVSQSRLPNSHVSRGSCFTLPPAVGSRF